MLFFKSILVFSQKKDTQFEQFTFLNNQLDSFETTQNIAYLNTFQNNISLVCVNTVKDVRINNGIKYGLALSKRLIKYPDYSISLFQLALKRQELLKNIDCIYELQREISKKYNRNIFIEEIKDTACLNKYKAIYAEKNYIDSLEKEQELYRYVYQQTVLRVLFPFLDNKNISKITTILSKELIQNTFSDEKEKELFLSTFYTFLLPNIEKTKLDLLVAYYGFKNSLPRENDVNNERKK